MCWAANLRDGTTTLSVGSALARDLASGFEAVRYRPRRIVAKAADNRAVRGAVRHAETMGGPETGEGLSRAAADNPQAWAARPQPLRLL